MLLMRVSREDQEKASEVYGAQGAYRILGGFTFHCGQPLPD